MTEKKEKMTSASTKRTAKYVGLLFMLATVTLFIGQAFYSPILGSPDYLSESTIGG